MGIRSCCFVRWVNTTWHKDVVKSQYSISDMSHKARKTRYVTVCLIVTSNAELHAFRPLCSYAYHRDLRNSLKICVWTAKILQYAIVHVIRVLDMPYDDGQQEENMRLHTSEKLCACPRRTSMCAWRDATA